MPSEPTALLDTPVATLPVPEALLVLMKHDVITVSEEFWQTAMLPEPTGGTVVKTVPPVVTAVSDGAAGRPNTVTVSDVVELTQLGVTH